MLQFMGSQRVKHNLVTEQQHSPLFNYHFTAKEIITLNSFYLLQTFNILMSRINFKQRVSQYFFPLEIFGLEALNHKI